MIAFFPAVVLASAFSIVAAEEIAWLDLGVAGENLAITLSSATPSVAAALRRRRGRPRKFAAPSRAITLTLPEHVLDTLAGIDADPSRAIVQLAGRQRRTVPKPAKAELAVFGNRAVITVEPTKSLEQRTGVDLVPLPDGRALISFEQATTIAELELLLYDALESKDLPTEDREVFEAIGAILKQTRRSNGVSLLLRSIIVLESTNGAGPWRKPSVKGAAPKASKPRT